MKTIYLSITLFAFLVLVNNRATAQIDVPRCPVKVGNVTILDKNTLVIGDAACNALKDADRLADALNKGVKKYQDDAELKIRDLNKVMFDDAINKDAIKKFNKAANTWNSMVDDIKDLAEDDQCGVEAQFKSLNSFFNSQMATLKSLSEIVQETGNALTQLKPVASELLKISQELNKIAADAGRKSPKAKEQFDIIKKATDSLMKDFAAIAALDGTKLVKDGTDLATTVGPFITDCATCATALASSVGSLAAGTTATTVGTGGCPESAAAFGGSCWATVAGVPTAALSVTLGPLVSNAACQNVTGKVTQYQQYYDEINNFVNSAMAISNSIVNNVDDVSKASTALQVLATEFGNDAQSSINSIKQSMDVITDAFEATQKVANDRIAPRVKSVSRRFVRDIAKSIQHVKTCYAMYVSVANQVTPQAIDAAKNLITASATLVNTNKVLDNMADQSQKAVDAASKAAKDRYDNVNDKFRSLHTTLFGQAPVRDFTKIDVGKATAAVASLATDERKRDRAFDKAEDLVEEINRLVTGAVTAGENAFLGRDRAEKKNSVKQSLTSVNTSAEQALTVFTKVANNKVQTADDKADDPKAEARKAAIEKAKRKAKLEMMRKAVEQQQENLPEVNVVQLSQITPKTFTKFKTK
ncbi:MAG: hypothetical protein U0Y96_17185 [Candidatus Kapaibacterium sp.]